VKPLYLFAVFFAVLFAGLLSACKVHHDRPDGGWKGRELFAQTCVPCHGDGGHGDTQQGRAVGAKDLTRDEARRMRDAEIAHQIRVGKGKMPAFGSVLDEDQVQTLVSYVRSLQTIN